MKINDPRSTPSQVGIRPKAPRESGESTSPQDQVQIQGSPSLPHLKSARPNGKPQANQGNQQLHRKHWKDHSQMASIQAAGQAGLAGAVATSSLHYPDGRWNLKAIADKKMQEAGMVIDYSPQVRAETEAIVKAARPAPGVFVLPEDAKAPWVRDLRDEHFLSVDNGTLWTKMDPKTLAEDPQANVTSRDIDQLQGKPVKLPNGDIRVKIAVSDVDAVIKKGSALDRHMDTNGSSVYTPDKIFNLLPEELAEDIISLNPGQERLATIVEYSIAPDGTVKDEDVYQGIVRSRVKLDYSSVGAWYEGKAEPSPAMKLDNEILESLSLQDEAAQRLKIKRKERGALEFESNEVRILTEKGSAVGFEKGEKNRATELVENFMVTSNEVMSRFLRNQGMPTLERVVVVPEKWDRIVDLAAENGARLPKEPSGKALADFLAQQKAKDPKGFQELSFSVIKLVGRGEYQAIMPNEKLPGHFALGVENYSQCTASIRRGGDRIAARMLKAALAGKPNPYSESELKGFAQNVTEKESTTKKVERSIEKSVIATMLADRIGEQFQAVVSGTKDNRAFIRISDPPVEGSLMGAGKVKVGDKVKVQLKSVSVEKGFIDFVPVK